MNRSIQIIVDMDAIPFEVKFKSIALWEALKDVEDIGMEQRIWIGVNIINEELAYWLWEDGVKLTVEQAKEYLEGLSMEEYAKLLDRVKSALLDRVKSAPLDFFKNSSKN